jgi:rare lipoprotein A
MRALTFPGLFLIAVSCGPKNDGFRPPAEAVHTTSDARQGTNDTDFVKHPGNGTAGPQKQHPDQVGLATWYGEAFAGKKTANGERFDPTQYTAAHRKLPFGTMVEVKRVDTGRVVRVRINDRGPWGDDRRIIDLSRRAAEDLDIVRAGVSKVEIRVVSSP